MWWSAEEKYNDQLSTACGSLQTPLIRKRLSPPFNDAEGQGRRKKPCQAPHGWALWFLEDFPDSLMLGQAVIRFTVFRCLGSSGGFCFFTWFTSFMGMCFNVNIFNSVRN